MSNTEEAVGGLMDFLSDFRSPPAAPSPAAPPAAPPPPVAAEPPPPTYAPAAPARAPRKPPKPLRPPLNLASVKETVLNPTENPMATAALCLGLASVLIPLLAAPGIGLGVTSVYRSRRSPWVRGEARAIAGIAASVILGAFSFVVWMQLIGG